MKPIVAVVGRPNVGKSTLINKIARKRIAIVEDMPGVTRDRLYVDVEWLGREFIMVDTGGLEPDSDDPLLQDMMKQSRLAMDEADVILFIVDGRDGMQPSDLEIAHILRTSRKPVLLVVNKVDSQKQEANAYEFYSLGLGDPISISAANMLNFGDLLDDICDHFPSPDEMEDDPDTLKIAVIGRPNVGKSSLVNSLLGRERMIVSDIAGTTRDAVDSAFQANGQKYTLIDTAGLRKKAKVDDGVERYSVIRTLRAIDRSDVVLMLIDAESGVTEQDKRIAGYAHEAGKAAIILVNKWDLLEKDNSTVNEYTKSLRHELIFLTYAPILFISALTKQRLHKIPEMVSAVSEQNNLRVSTGTLNQVLQDDLAITPAPSVRGKRLKIYYVTQADTKPPTFIFFVNDPELFHFSYMRHLENVFRATFGFEGSPIRLWSRGRKEKDGDE
ncbi:MAG: ribosome biogenesis GTPase Der [Negativicutes bacterium]|jgi:GTP-binding protein|nr:ribosome biogenesis GTPase Der [Negativicutes bacterium]